MGEQKEREDQKGSMRSKRRPGSKNQVGVRCGDQNYDMSTLYTKSKTPREHQMGGKETKRLEQP